MNLTRREKLIVLVTAAAVLIFAYDKLLLTPMLQRAEQRAAERNNLTEELIMARRLVRLNRELTPRWRQMTDTSLKDDPTDAESQMLHAARTWSREAGLNLASMTPERPTGTGDLRQIIIAVHGSGSMSAITRFLFLLDQADLPVRVERLRIAGDEARGALMLELRLSTLYRAEPVSTSQARTAVERGRL